MGPFTEWRGWISCLGFLILCCCQTYLENFGLFIYLIGGSYCYVIFGIFLMLLSSMAKRARWVRSNLDKKLVILNELEMGRIKRFVGRVRQPIFFSHEFFFQRTCICHLISHATNYFEFTTHIMKEFNSINWYLFNNYKTSLSCNTYVCI